MTMGWHPRWQLSVRLGSENSQMNCFCHPRGYPEAKIGKFHWRKRCQKMAKTWTNITGNENIPYFFTFFDWSSPGILHISFLDWKWQSLPAISMDSELPQCQHCMSHLPGCLGGHLRPAWTAAGPVAVVCSFTCSPLVNPEFLCKNTCRSYHLMVFTHLQYVLSIQPISCNMHTFFVLCQILPPNISPIGVFLTLSCGYLKAWGSSKRWRPENLWRGAVGRWWYQPWCICCKNLSAGIGTTTLKYIRIVIQLRTM